MKKIFMIGYSGNKGGIETYIDQLAAVLPQFEIIYSRPVMKIEGKIWRRPPNRHRYLSYRLFWRRFFRENHFDVLYYNTCDIVSIDMLKFAKHAGIPVRIIHSHNSGIQQAIGKKLSLFHQLTERHNKKVLSQYATHFFACSRAAGDWLFDGHPYTVIKNGIQISEYTFCEENRKKLRQTLGIKHELLVGVIGRLSPQKNPLFSVQILQALMKKDSSARGVFLGDGELRKQTEMSVQEADLQNRVHFMGNVDNVNEWMSAIDVLLMPSLFEGLPFVLVEAQASGLPCIVSSAISREVNITGIIQFVDLTDAPEVWADRILHTDTHARLDKSKQLIDAGYSVEDTARTVDGIITDSLKRQGG